MKSFRKQRKGFTLIELLIVIAVIAILAAIAIPNLLSSRKAANEASAIGSMRTINSAEATYRARNSTYATLPQLSTGSLVDPALGGATASGATLKSGYFFVVNGTSATQYYTTGQPGTTSSGDRSFYSDESGVIWANTGNVAAAADTSGATPAGSNWSQVGQ